MESSIESEGFYHHNSKLFVPLTTLKGQRDYNWYHFRGYWSTAFLLLSAPCRISASLWWLEGTFFPTGQHSAASTPHSSSLLTGSKWSLAPTRRASFFFLLTAHREIMHCTFISFTPILLGSSLTLLSTTWEDLIVKKQSRFVCQKRRTNYFGKRKYYI